MTWICKKCGQIQSDSIIYSDEICDDCFEKMKNKKKKGSGFNKILSLALVLSFMLCIFSGFGVASAEGNFLGDISPLEYDGTYMGYNLIKYDENFSVSFAQLQNLIIDTAPEGTTTGTWHLMGALLQFDASGQPIIYSTGTEGYVISCKADFSSLKDDPYDSNFMYAFFKCMNNSKSSYAFNKQYGSYTDLYWTYGAEQIDIKVNLVDKSLESKEYSEVLTYTNLAEGFNGFVGSGDVYLLIYVSDQSYTTNGIASQLLAGSKSDFVAVSKNTSPEANFYTCKSAPFTDTSHGLYVKSWLKDGEQYPYFGWWINDNGNNHKYKVVFSYNDTQKDLFETFYNSTRSNPLFSDGWWIEKAFPIISISKDSMIIANEMATQTGFADFMANKTWWMWHYNTLFTLNHSSMDFTSQTGNKIYSINLSDYSSIYEYLFYRAQIVDVTTGNILDTVYFTSQESYNKSDSGYGSKVYDYGDNSQGMIDDLLNNNPTVEPGNQGSFDVDGDTIDSPIIDENGNAVWDNINIGGMYSPLSFGLSAVSDFFQSLWLIYPNEIKSIIISGISLIVILRILGR